MTKFISDFIGDEAGAAAAEYALILAIVGAGIAGAAFYLGGKISTAMHDTGDKVATCSAGTATGC
jgi:pilus assembly protein Flp/PilA